MTALLAQAKTFLARPLVAAVLAALTAVGITVIITDTPSPTPGAPASHTVTVSIGAGQKKVLTTASPSPAAAVRSVIAAGNAPDPSAGVCSPAVGAGQLGACAPKAALAATRSLAGPVAHAAGAGSSVANGRPVGVDVSSYQGCSIDWRRVSVSFMFFKATEGTGYTDPCLRHNVASAKQAGKPFGVYDFLRPGSSSATAEANHFVAAVKAAGANSSLPPVADVEVNRGLSRSALNAYVCTWHRTVGAALHRRVTITYTGNWFWAPQLAGNHCGSKLWVSAYTFAPIIPRPWKSYVFWQYSDGVYGPGPHLTRWDSDVFAGSSAQLRALAVGVAAHVSALPGYTGSEQRWIHEYDHLKATNTSKARRVVLQRVMRAQRKRIWRLAQPRPQGDGHAFRVHHRRVRYRSLLARSR